MLAAVDTNDADIRARLLTIVRQEHIGNDTLFLEEMALYGGSVRADLAVLNDCSHAYEIKSSRDTLARLPRQIGAYNAIFDRITLVTVDRHLQEAQQLIPQWWGIWQVLPTGDGMALLRMRASLSNPKRDPHAIAALLWKPEALRLLQMLGLDSGVRSKPMDDLVDRLAQRLSPEALYVHVRQALRARGDWRSGARRKQRDGMYRRHASPWYSQCTVSRNISE